MKWPTTGPAKILLIPLTVPLVTFHASKGTLTHPNARQTSMRAIMRKTKDNTVAEMGRRGFNLESPNNFFEGRDY